jgi:integrase
MRMKEAFSIYKRRLATGRVVYYYQFYGENGRRSCGHSTGKSTKTAAREFCIARIKEGQLAETKRGRVPTFAEFAEGWWVEDTCPYIKSKAGRRPLSKSYAALGRSCLKNHILPVFGDMRIDRITDSDIDGWLLAFQDEGYSASTANSAFKTLQVMMGWAYRKRITKSNPCDLVDALATRVKERDLLTENELAALFPEDWRERWDDYLCYAASRLASCTGMRVGEVLGLRVEYVHETYLDVCGQYGRFGYIPHTKTQKDRTVPIPPEMYEELRVLMNQNKEGFVFSRNGGLAPVSRDHVTDAFTRALRGINLGDDEIKRRGLTFHSWRHFLNTKLREADVADSKVRSVTGHLTTGMTDHYTHFDNREFSEVRKVQEKLIARKTKKQDTDTKKSDAA